MATPWATSRVREPSRYLAMMKTGVPTFTCWKSHSASGIRMRMQPCEAE